jgi:hypothetical protein
MEAAGRIERSVPGHICERDQRYGPKTLIGRPPAGGLDELAANPHPGVLGQDAQLLEVGQPINNVDSSEAYCRPSRDENDRSLAQ